jgi:hypothetical protein
VLAGAAVGAASKVGNVMQMSCRWGKQYGSPHECRACGSPDGRSGWQTGIQTHEQLIESHTEPACCSPNSHCSANTNALCTTHLTSPVLSCRSCVSVQLIDQFAREMGSCCGSFKLQQLSGSCACVTTPVAKASARAVSMSFFSRVAATEWL